MGVCPYLSYRRALHRFTLAGHLAKALGLGIRVHSIACSVCLILACTTCMQRACSSFGMY